MIPATSGMDHPSPSCGRGTVGVVEGLRARGVECVSEPVALLVATLGLDLAALAAGASRRSAAGTIRGVSSSAVAALVWPERPDGLLAFVDDSLCLGCDHPLGGGAWLTCRGSSLEVHAPCALPNTVRQCLQGRRMSELILSADVARFTYPVAGVRSEVRGRRAERHVVFVCDVPKLDVATAASIAQSRAASATAA